MKVVDFHSVVEELKDRDCPFEYLRDIKEHHLGTKIYIVDKGNDLVVDFGFATTFKTDEWMGTPSGIKFSFQKGKFRFLSQYRAWEDEAAPEGIRSCWDHLQDEEFKTDLFRRRIDL